MSVYQTHKWPVMIVLVLSLSNCCLGVSYSTSVDKHLVFVITSGRLDMHLMKMKCLR